LGSPSNTAGYKPAFKPFGEETAPQTAFDFLETLLSLWRFDLNFKTLTLAGFRFSNASLTLSNPMLLK
jgi:hypothetical protein